MKMRKIRAALINLLIAAPVFFVLLIVMLVLDRQEWARL